MIHYADTTLSVRRQCALLGLPRSALYYEATNEPEENLLLMKLLDEEYTCHPFISMDGRGRALDNIFVERLWRALKYEEVYLKDYSSAIDAKANIGNYFKFYNFERHHQHLAYKKPAEIYFNRAFPLGYLDNRPSDCPVPQRIMYHIQTEVTA